MQNDGTQDIDLNNDEDIFAEPAQDDLKAQVGRLTRIVTKLSKEKERVVETPPSQPKVETSSDDSWKKKMEFVVGAGRELGQEELSEVIAYAEGKKISYEEAYNSPVLKAGLDVIREQKRAEQAATIAESTKSEIERKFTTEQLRNMSVQELEKILPHADPP